MLGIRSIDALAATILIPLVAYGGLGASERPTNVDCAGYVQSVQKKIKKEEQKLQPDAINIKLDFNNWKLSKEQITCVGRAIRTTTVYGLVYDECLNEGNVRERKSMTPDERAKYII